MPKPVTFDFGLKPQAAMDYLANKGYKLSFDYDEIQGEAHHRVFTVAKVTRVDLLDDIFNSLKAAQASGETFKSWQAKLKPTLQKKGWWGEKVITNPITGEAKTVYIGSRRLRTIFNTNMRVAYSVQRYQTMRKLPLAEYWRYSSLFLPNSRDAHEALDGTLLHRDDPFWKTNYPPNGWNCKCKVRAFTKKQAEKRGLQVAEKAPKSIADKDWAYDVGAGSRVGALNKLNLGDGLEYIKPNTALDDLTEAQLKQRFYSKLALGPTGGHFIDKVGDPMMLDDELFSDAKGNSKITKRQRHLYLDTLADALGDPDEIYLEVENRSGKSHLVKKMFKYFETEDGSTKAAMGLFTYAEDKTQNTTLYVVDAKVLDKKRIEKLIYQKPTEE